METPTPEISGNGKPPRYSFLAELLTTTQRNEQGIAKVLERQEETTAIVLTLKEHRTIEKTDELWTALSNVQFAARVVVKTFGWMLGIATALAALAYSLHQLFGWF